MTLTDERRNDAGPIVGRVGRWLVSRSSDCIRCGICAEVCPTGVHSEGDGFVRILQPRSERCVGPECLSDGKDCRTECPEEALTVAPNSSFMNMGDPRWSPDLLSATWYESEHAVAPRGGFEYRVGESGGGFDKLRFDIEDRLDEEWAELRAISPRPAIVPGEPDPWAERLRNAYGEALTQVDLTLPLNRRSTGERITLGVPWYGGGMSYGSISVSVMLARARAAQKLGSFTSTGEGGYPAELAAYKEHVITQVATGLFGVREETLQWARVIEIKYAQGAKPGLGGHLLADKVTRDVAEVREAVEHTNLFSPFPFHSVYSVEDHKKHVDWLKAVNPRALISVKVATPEDVDMVAVGSYYAGAHIIHLDGGYGGTGAAPDIAKKNIAMPVEYAIPRAHRFLEKEGIRDEVTLMASGGLRSPYDVAKAIALGADGVIIGTAELVALDCVRCGNCESGRGCPKGIATTDAGLTPIVGSDWGALRIVNMYSAWMGELALLLRRVGIRGIAELRGRVDLLKRA